MLMLQRKEKKRKEKGRTEIAACKYFQGCSESWRISSVFLFRVGVVRALGTALRSGYYCCDGGEGEKIGLQQSPGMAPGQCPEKWQTCHG